MKYEKPSIKKFVWDFVKQEYMTDKEKISWKGFRNDTFTVMPKYRKEENDT